MKKKIILLTIVWLMSMGIGSFAAAYGQRNVELAVVSDVHVMDPSLLRTDGTAFKKYLLHDRKMLKESTALLESFTNQMLKTNPDYLFIPGDLTKDGEEVSHRYLVEHCLKRLRDAGIVVLVVPGNHDVNNPHACAYEGDHTTRVKSVSKEEFASIYADYGYGKALARDSSSLSYIYQLAPKLRVLALDACEYDRNDYNKNTCTTGGQLRPTTLDFIRRQLADAAQRGIRVIAMMHHGIVEHWRYQNKVLPGYVVDNWKSVSSMLHRLGVEVVFTGHSHAQDIAQRGHLFDVETGSLVTYPCPYRMVNLHEDGMNITTQYIQHPNIDTDGKSFSEYALGYLRTGFRSIINNEFLTKLPDKVKAGTVDFLADILINNYCGDEHLSAAEQQQLNTVCKQLRSCSHHWATVCKHVACAIGNDRRPCDNTFQIEFRTKLK